MSSVVDLTQENDDNYNCQSPHAPHISISTQPRHLIRIKVDMCPVSKPSIRFGPGRGRGGGGGRGGATIYRRYVDTAVTCQMKKLRDICHTALNGEGLTILPRQQPCILKAWFFMRRPEEDFVCRRRGPGRLREEASSDGNTIVAIKPDVDNYGKFLLDSLKGALFEDDAQVVALQMYKLRDNEGMCNGRMMIECSSLDDAAMDSIIPGW